MRFTHMLLAILVCGVLLVGMPARAADMTNLQIKITNEAGKPVGNASVIVKFVKGRSIKLTKIRKEWTMRSSQEGMARVPAIPQGEILIQIIAKNYQTFGQAFNVNEEQKTIEITLKAPQAQYSAH